MPRLDAERLALWRLFVTSSERLTRAVEADLMVEFELPLGWFEVLGALQRAGGEMRVHELCEEIAAVPSSLSRRLDRMEDDGWIERRRGSDATDGRAVLVVLTREGRDSWRDANIVYRRSVQTHFARQLTESDLVALSRVFAKIGHPEPAD